MRLRNAERGHRLPEKIKLRMIQAMSLAPAPDIIKTLMYRPSFFGKPFSAITHEVMRGPSEWSVGERELFAAFVSRQNQCPF